MGTALERHQADTNISRKAASYNLAAGAVDGMDVLAVEAAARRAADFVRNGNGPFLLELRTYRFRAHSMSDPDLYRTKEEIEEWKKRDPITLFQARLREWGLLSNSDLIPRWNPKSALRSMRRCDSRKRVPSSRWRTCSRTWKDQ